MMAAPRAQRAAARRALFAVWNLADPARSCLVVAFSILKPRHLPHAPSPSARWSNSRSINAMVALAVMIPLAANKFDLSVASILGICAGAGQRPADAAASALAAGGRARPAARRGWSGCVNGVLVTRVRDQLLHRHARLGHGAARPQPVVHGRPPGRRRADRRLHQALRPSSGASAFRSPLALRAGHRRWSSGWCSTTCRSAATSTSSATARGPRR